MNLPNKITMARIVMIPLFMLALAGSAVGGQMNAEAFRLAAASVFVLASISDFVDGYLARKMKLVTTFGKFMDPIADKLLVSAALIMLTSMGEIPAWMVVVIISRDSIISGMRLVAAEKGVVIAASVWAKIKTAIQMVMIIMLLLNAEGIRPDEQIFPAVCGLLKWLAVGLTVVSAAEYIYKNKSLFSDKKAGGA